MKRLVMFAAVPAFLISMSGLAAAQAARTWVSGVGDDVNPCSRTAPCKTFAGAISKTAAAGEINVIDSGGFGTVTITKSISIIAEGSTAGITAPAVNGIIINAAPTSRVYLEGLDIEGIGESPAPGLNGIRVLNAGTVIIRDTNIRGFRNASAGVGIDVQSASATKVYVIDSIITNNLTGISVKNTVAVNQVFIDNTQIIDNLNVSLRADGSKARAFIDNSVLRGAAADLSAVSDGRINSFYTSQVGTGTPSNTAPLTFQ